MPRKLFHDANTCSVDIVYIVRQINYVIRISLLSTETSTTLSVVLTRIKTRVVFPDPPLLTPDEGPSLETSIFPLSFQVVREPLPFAYH